MMTRIGTVTICGQTFDLAKSDGVSTPTHAVLAREGLDLYERPMAVSIDLESEMQAIGNVAMVEALLLLLAQAMQERDAARAALQKGAGLSS